MNYRDVFQEANDRHRKRFDKDYQRMLRRKDFYDTILSILILPVCLIILLFYTQKCARAIICLAKVHSFILLVKLQSLPTQNYKKMKKKNYRKRK